MILPSAEYATERVPFGSSIVNFTFPVAASHSLICPRVLPLPWLVAMNLPSGETARLHIVAPCGRTTVEFVSYSSGSPRGLPGTGGVTAFGSGFFGSSGRACFDVAVTSNRATDSIRNRPTDARRVAAMIRLAHEEVIVPVDGVRRFGVVQAERK